MSHSICFQAGPYRRWSLYLTGIGRYGGDDGSGRILVEVEAPGQPYGPRGRLVLAHGNPGYDIALIALNGVGREAKERALTWVLNHVAELLAEPEGMAAQLRDTWQTIVDAGLAARAEYDEKWGHEREPQFLAVGQVVAVVTEVASCG